MAEAILGGILKAKKIQPENIYCNDINKKKTAEFVKKFGVKTFTDEGVFDYNLLSVKPQNVEEISLGSNKDSVLISICAGISLQTLENQFKMDKCVRVMPNTPALVNQAMSVWMASKGLDEEHKRDVASLLSSFGHEMEVKIESHLDISTALSGSGPA